MEVYREALAAAVRATANSIDYFGFTQEERTFWMLMRPGCPSDFCEKILDELVCVKKTEWCVRTYIEALLHSDERYYLWLFADPNVLQLFIKRVSLQYMAEIFTETNNEDRFYKLMSPEFCVKMCSNAFKACCLKRLKLAVRNDVAAARAAGFADGGKLLHTIYPFMLHRVKSAQVRELYTWLRLTPSDCASVGLPWVFKT